MDNGVAVFTSPSSSKVGSSWAAKAAAADRAKDSLADREGKTRETWLVYLMVRMDVALLSGEWNEPLKAGGSEHPGGLIG